MKRLVLVSLPVVLITATLVILLLELSGYPGTLDDTQLGFSAEIIKAHFAMMKSEDIKLFILGNFVDYAFMIAYGCFFYCSARYLSWDYQQGSLPLKVGKMMAWIGVLSAISDAVENVFLLSMTANPVGFPNWLAIAHSTFALLKFILMYLTIGWLILSFVLNKIPSISKRINSEVQTDLVK
ncbi:MAG: hypothetical protein JSW11_01390 [Candidatus Heimdallarchaeota archaeon]|nr:MAG: hypothetical protein JSW11_01390 [Candidatus Heimdallarchaeota archaeon]